MRQRLNWSWFRRVPHVPSEIDLLLAPLAPVLAKEADTLLDLRELLANRGHPGKCVRCFFKLFGAAGSEDRPRLRPLISWMKEHLEISVSGDGSSLEILPVDLKPDEDLESFCFRTIKSVRMDRSYAAKRLRLAFRYKRLAA